MVGGGVVGVVVGDVGVVSVCFGVIEGMVVCSVCVVRVVCGRVAHAVVQHRIVLGVRVVRVGLVGLVVIVVVVVCV